MKLIKIFYFLLGFIFLDFCLSRTSLPINKYSYTMGYKKIYKKIKDTKGQKRIILFGGSSLAWGLSAKDLTNDLRILTLNSGIHGAMGTKRILSTVIDVIEKDKDLIVISPEYQSINQNFAKSRSKEYCEIILYTLNKYPTECIGYSLNKVIRLFPTFNKKSGDYFKSGFNEYGDYVYRRQQVNMIGKVRKDKNCINFSNNDLVQHYIPLMKELKNKGYKIVYIPTLIPKGCGDLSDINTFHNLLYEEFGIKGFKNMDLQEDHKYFYNSNYHLTKEGVKLRTKYTLNQLNKFLYN